MRIERIGSYQVAAKIGEGGMGEVYRARDIKSHGTLPVSQSRVILTDGVRVPSHLLDADARCLERGWLELRGTMKAPMGRCTMWQAATETQQVEIAGPALDLFPEARKTDLRHPADPHCRRR